MCCFNITQCTWNKENNNLYSLGHFILIKVRMEDSQLCLSIICYKACYHVISFAFFFQFCIKSKWRIGLNIKACPRFWAVSILVVQKRLSEWLSFPSCDSFTFLYQNQVRSVLSLKNFAEVWDNPLFCFFGNATRCFLIVLSK